MSNDYLNFWYFLWLVFQFKHFKFSNKFYKKLESKNINTFLFKIIGIFKNQLKSKLLYRKINVLFYDTSVCLF